MTGAQGRRTLVNDWCLYRGGTGISIYIRNLLAHWPEDEDLRPVCYCGVFRSSFSRALRSFPIKSNSLNFRLLRDVVRPGQQIYRLPHWLRRPIQKQYARSFRKEFGRGNYAAYFEPNNLAIPSPNATVTTVHDLSVIEHPEWHPRDRVMWWRAGMQHSLDSTEHWIAPSRFTRDRMVAVLGVSPDSITVIPLAARPLPYPRLEELQRRKETGQIPELYLLHLAALEPRKNLIVLLDAYAALPARLRSACRLVLAGPLGWGRKSFWTSLSNHPMSAEVLATGYVSDQDTAVLLAGATALLMPSRYEGFGLPLVEALACGTPVICSNAEAFKELVGDAVPTIHTDDVSGWSAAIRRAVEEVGWRERMTKAALAAPCNDLSWDKTARMHLQAISATVGTKCGE